jgi:hypothetical protein
VPDTFIVPLDADADDVADASASSGIVRFALRCTRGRGCAKAINDVTRHTARSLLRTPQLSLSLYSPLSAQLAAVLIWAADRQPAVCVSL